MLKFWQSVENVKSLYCEYLFFILILFDDTYLHILLFTTKHKFVTTVIKYEKLLHLYLTPLISAWNYKLQISLTYFITENYHKVHTAFVTFHSWILVSCSWQKMEWQSSESLRKWLHRNYSTKLPRH